VSVELLISLNALAIGANTVWVISLMKKYYKLNRRVTALEEVHFIRQWLKAIEEGESMSDMSYMKQKGFLK